MSSELYTKDQVELAIHAFQVSDLYKKLEVTSEETKREFKGLRKDINHLEQSFDRKMDKRFSRLYGFIGTLAITGGAPMLLDYLHYIKIKLGI